ncbi:MAG: SH3 domain-containing protein [Anaerolineae bacterium]|nr:SH3 domain-containing protein [Anaerolineae bacterium]
MKKAGLPGPKLCCVLLGVVALLFSFAPVQAQQDNKPRLTVSYEDVNVRQGPGMTYPVVGTLWPDRSYVIVGRNGSWWQINYYDEVVGWVYSKYVTVTNVTRSNVPIVGVCPFSSHLAPDCPAQQRVMKVNYQSFEHGIMVWFPTKTVLVLTYGVCSMFGEYGFAAQYYVDTWKGEALPDQHPPNGLQQPRQGFGKIWLDYNLRQTIGWATSGENSYNTPVEYSYARSASQVKTYLRLPKGQIVEVGGYNGTYYWLYPGQNGTGKCRQAVESVPN